MHENQGWCEPDPRTTGGWGERGAAVEWLIKGCWPRRLVCVWWGGPSRLSACLQSFGHACAKAWGSSRTALQSLPVGSSAAILAELMPL